MKKILKSKAGFTLIEIIGVLAVISVLAALVAPKVFDTIAQSKAAALASDLRSYQSAIQDWYADVGTLRVLTTTGSTAVVPNCGTLVTATGTTTDLGLQLMNKGTNTLNLWTRWRGPYLDSVKSTSIGTVNTLNVCLGTATTPSNANTNFSLSESAALQSSNNGKITAYLSYSGVTVIDWRRIEQIVDGGTATNGASNGEAGGSPVKGKVKFDGAVAVNAGTNGNMIIYLDSAY